MFFALQVSFYLVLLFDNVQILTKNTTNRVWIRLSVLEWWTVQWWPKPFAWRSRLVIPGTHDGTPLAYLSKGLQNEIHNNSLYFTIDLSGTQMCDGVFRQRVMDNVREVYFDTSLQTHFEAERSCWSQKGDERPYTIEQFHSGYTSKAFASLLRS